MCYTRLLRLQWKLIVILLSPVVVYSQDISHIELARRLNSTPNTVYAIQASLKQISDINFEDTTKALIKFNNNSSAQYCNIALGPGTEKDQGKEFLNFLASVLTARNLNYQDKSDFLECAFPVGYDNLKTVLSQYQSNSSVDILLKNIQTVYEEKIQFTKNLARDSKGINSMDTETQTVPDYTMQTVNQMPVPQIPPVPYPAQTPRPSQPSYISQKPPRPTPPETDYSTDMEDVLPDEDEDEFNTDIPNPSSELSSKDIILVKFLKTNPVFYSATLAVFEKTMQISPFALRKALTKFANGSSYSVCNIDTRKFDLPDKLRNFLSFFASLMGSSLSEDNRLQILSCLFKNNVDAVMKSSVFFQKDAKYATFSLEDKIYDHINSNDSYLRVADMLDQYVVQAQFQNSKDRLIPLKSITIKDVIDRKLLVDSANRIKGRNGEISEDSLSGKGGKKQLQKKGAKKPKKKASAQKKRPVKRK